MVQGRALYRTYIFDILGQVQENEKDGNQTTEGCRLPQNSRGRLHP